MNLLSCLKSYVTVVNYQSFSAASRHLGISPAKLSNQITWIEKFLKTKLLIRSTRRLVLTEAGRLLYERAGSIIDEVDQLKIIVQSQANEPEGWIRLCMTVTPAIPYFTQLCLQFMRDHPRLEIYIIVGSEIIGLNENQYDVVISFDPITHPQLTCKKLFGIRRGIFAAPAYLEEHGEPKSVDELVNHNCLINTLYGLQNKWILNKRVVQVSGNFKSNNATVLKQAAMLGAGLIWVPPFTVFEEEQKGLLKRVLTEEISPEIVMYAIYSRYLSDQNKVKILLDYFRDQALQAGFAIS